MKKFFAVLMTFVMAFILVGCKKTPELSFEVTTYNLKVGEETTLKPTIVNLEGEDLVTYKVSSDGIIKIEGNKAVALKEGEATVTVNLKGYEEKVPAVTLTFKVEKIAVSDVKVAGEKQVRKGETIKLTAVVEPETATYKEVTWATADEKIAKVAKDGTVTGVATGKVKISATADGVKKEFEVEVLNPLATKVTVKGEATMVLGTEQTLVVEIAPEDAVKNLTFATSDEKIATVDKDGKVKAIAAGEVTITAKNDNVEGKLVIVVKAPDAESVELTGATDLKIGETCKLAAAVKPEAADQKVTLTADPADLVEIAEDGTVKALKAGTVTITAKTANGKVATATIVIKALAESVELTGAADMKVFDTLKLTATVKPAEADQKVTLTADPADLVEIAEDGTIKALKAGTVTITATTDNEKTASVTINIAEANYDKTRVIVDASLVDGAGFTENEIQYKVGANAFKTLAEALAVVEENGTVVVKAGTYEGDAEATKAVTITGVEMPTYKGALTVTSNTTVEGLTFEGVGQLVVKAAETVENVVVRGCKFENVNIVDGSQGYIYVTQPINNLVVENNEVNGALCARFVRTVSTVNNLKVHNNKFNESKGMYDWIRTDKAVMGEVSFVNNFFANSNQSALMLMKHGAGNFEFINNVFNKINNVCIDMRELVGDENSVTTFNCIHNTFDHTGATKDPWGCLRLRFAGYKAENLEVNVNFNTFIGWGDVDVIENAGTVKYEGKIVNVDNNYFDNVTAATIDAKAEKMFGTIGLSWANTYDTKEALEAAFIDANMIVVKADLAEGENGVANGRGYKQGVNAYKTIAEAIAAAKDGNVIVLMAGTYKEDFAIEKALTFVGPNKGVDPNKAARGAEATIEGAIDVKASNVKFDGIALAGKRVKFFGQLENFEMVNTVFTMRGESTSGGRVGAMSIESDSELKTIRIANNKVEMVGGMGVNFIAFYGKVTDMTMEDNVISNGGTDTGYSEALRSNNVAGIYNIRRNDITWSGDNFTVMLGSSGNFCTEINFIENTIAGGEFHASGIYFVYMDPATNTNVIGNKFINVGGTTIRFKQYAEGALAKVMYNYFDENSAFKVTDKSGAVVTNNHNCYMATPVEGGAGGITVDKTTETTYDSLEALLAAYEAYKNPAPDPAPAE